MMNKNINEAETDSSDNTKKCKERRLFLGCLPKSLSRNCLVNHFSQFGSVLDFEFNIMPQKDGKSKLINAILTCSSVEMKDTILQQPNIIEGHQLKIVPYLDPSELQEILNSTRRRKIYIKRLPSEFDNDSLKDYFLKYGLVQKAYCVEGTRKRKNLKYGYVIFKDEKTVQILPKEGFPFKGTLISWASFSKNTEQDKIEEQNSEDEGSVGNNSEESNPRRLLSKGKSPKFSRKRNKVYALDSAQNNETSEIMRNFTQNKQKKINRKNKKNQRKRKRVLTLKKNLDHNLRPGKAHYHNVHNEIGKGTYKTEELKFKKKELIDGITGSNFLNLGQNDYFNQRQNREQHIGFHSYNAFHGTRRGGNIGSNGFGFDGSYNSSYHYQ